MMYHLRNDVACPKCKNTTFKIEDHTEQFPQQDKNGIAEPDNDVFIRWREIYCDKCFTTIERIET